MDYTEEALRDMSRRELDVIFAEAFCGMHILKNSLYDMPGFVVEQLSNCQSAVTVIPPFSSAHYASPYLLQCVHRQGFTYRLMVNDSQYRCQVFKRGWQLSDVRLPRQGNSMRVLMIAAILAAQLLQG